LSGAKKWQRKLHLKSISSSQNSPIGFIIDAIVAVGPTVISGISVCAEYVLENLHPGEISLVSENRAGKGEMLI
jgi:hypothetical protein